VPRPATARLFVAVIPPPEVLDRIAALPRPDEPGVRWTRRHQWHVTLRFLGDAPVDEVIERLAGLDHPAVTAELGPAVSRLGRGVVCVPVGGLESLAAAVAERTADVGDPPDPRPFAGHVTLARLRRRGACGLAGTPFRARFDVDRIELVNSQLGPGGPAYVTTWAGDLG
jgi:2'-5' RNA ligase